MSTVGRIARRAAARLIPRLATKITCSACGQAPEAHVRLIAGPNVYLCSTCFADAAQRLAPRSLPPESERCRFCGHPRPPADVTRAGTIVVCSDCLGVMERILSAPDQ